MFNYRNTRLYSKIPGFWMFLMAMTYVVITMYALRTYIIWQSVNVALGLISLPIVTMIKPANKNNLRYAIAGLLVGILSFVLPVKTLLFLTIVFALLFIVESFSGKINGLPLLVLGLMSPLFQYATNVFSFPIRLQLTGWAGQIMNTAGLPVTVKGNMIFSSGNEFVVDPACMGLNMLITSFLLQAILIGVYQKKYQVQLPLFLSLLLMASIIPLNIISNLLRIICLVQLTILPGTLMHEVIGIICLLFYVMIPAVFITRWMVRRKGKPLITASGEPKVLRPAKMIGMHIVLVSTTLFAAYNILHHDGMMNDHSGKVAAVPGYRVQRIAADIIKLENEQTLIYLKSIPGFYNADHNPMICWRGSGYVFKQIEQQSMQGVSIYTALLHNGKDQLHTAWWYDNGNARTIEQLSWRWDVLKGANTYSVVNVTANNRMQLEQAIYDIMRNNRLRQLL